MANVMHPRAAGNPPALRPYQLDAIERARARFASVAALLLVAPTGAGKTVIAAEIIRRAHARRSRVVFFAHRRELILQTRRKLLAAGIPPADVGVLMAADPLANAAAPIQVASIDTWRHREPPAANLVIIDEAHRSLAGTYLAAIEHYRAGGAKLLGLTATPYRADGGGLGDVYEALEVVTTPAQLIADGFLVSPSAWSAPPDARPDLEHVRIRIGDYKESDLAAAVNTVELVASLVGNWRRRANGVRTVAFAVNVEHSEAIAAAFVADGVPAEHLDGNTPTGERDAILGRLERGETLVVSNCGVLCEGWDQPAVKCAILARPTKSQGLYLQQAGRILRPWQNQPAIILDHGGNCLEHGLPQDEREFSLAATQPKGPAPCKTCRACEAVIPAGARECPQCGEDCDVEETKRTPEAGEPVELVEVRAYSEDELRDGWAAIVEDFHRRNHHRPVPMRPGWCMHRFKDRFGRRPPPGCKLPPEAATEEQKLEALAELQTTAAARGYKPRWALHRFEARFGHQPEQRA